MKLLSGHETLRNDTPSPEKWYHFNYATLEYSNYQCKHPYEHRNAENEQAEQVVMK